MMRFKAGFGRRISAAAGVVVLMGAAISVGQDAAIPIKLGLWETTASTANLMSLSPDAEAKIAAMPPDQQAMVRRMTGGGGAPVSITTKRCIAGVTTMDTLLDQSQNHPGAKCTFTNRKQTASGASFDTTCTMPQGTMTGHSEFHMVDSDHMTGTTHMEGSMTGRNGSAMPVKMSSTMTSKYLGADCGDVKPYTPPAAQ